MDYARRYTFKVKVPIAVKSPLPLHKILHFFTTVNKACNALNSYIEITSQFYLGFKSNFREN